MMHWIVLGITLCIVINQNITSAFETLVHPSTFVEVHELGNTDGNRITENAAIYLDISLQECSRRCQHMKACDFVNYHVASQTCFIVRHEDTTIGVTFKHRKGFTLGVKTDWTFTVDPNCDFCSVKDICTLTNGTSSCTIAGCGTPDIPENTTAVGNVYNVGSLVHVSCNASFVSGPGSSQSIRCQEVGTWSNLDITCLSLPEAASTTTPSPSPTTQAPFSCLVLDTLGFCTVTLDDSSQLTYRVFQDTEVDHSEAVSVCRDYGAELLKITSMDRFYYASALVKSLDYKTPGVYWIDAYRSGDTNIFYTSDNQAIPMSDEVWENKSGFQTCAGIESDTGKINDSMYYDTLYFICELVPIVDPRPSEE